MNRNSALIWLPKIEALGLPTPKTIMVSYDHNEFVAALECGDYIDPKPIYAAVIKACEKIGWPCFVRTDLASAKHKGPCAYLADNPASVPLVICRTVEDNEMKFWPYNHHEPPEAFLVREFLILDYMFTAFHDLPIAREWRFFSDGKKVLCAHPYWPIEAFENWQINYRGWEKVLAEHHKKPLEFYYLSELAMKAARACGGEWSIDFAADCIGNWFLIDMATAQDSWHWPGCPNA